MTQQLCSCFIVLAMLAQPTAASARFLSPDPELNDVAQGAARQPGAQYAPLQDMLRSPASLQAFTYANGNPTRYTDPDGRFGVVGAIVGGAFGFFGSLAEESNKPGGLTWLGFGKSLAWGVGGAVIGAVAPQLLAAKNVWIGASTAVTLAGLCTLNVASGAADVGHGIQEISKGAVGAGAGKLALGIGKMAGGVAGALGLVNGLTEVPSTSELQSAINAGFKNGDGAVTVNQPGPQGEIAGDGTRVPNEEWAQTIPRTALPPNDGGKTHGVLHTPTAEPLPIQSGKAGPSQGVRGQGLPGFNGNQLMHVEGHAAAHMRMNQIGRGVLDINKVPCAAGPGGGCSGLLPRMLPAGAELTVRGPGGYMETFVGSPDPPARMPRR